MRSNELKYQLKEPRLESGVFCIEDIRARDNAVDFKIRLHSDSYVASRRLLEDIYRLRPTMLKHCCSSPDESEAISIPHLIEHLAIDILVEQQLNQCRESAPIAGYSVWLDRNSGLARITLGTKSARDTYGAIVQACNMVSELYLSLQYNRQNAQIENANETTQRRINS